VDAREAWLGRTTLERIDDAAGLDPRDRTAFDPVAGPLVVVCTHGRRDPCCAERGRPIVATAAASHPGRVWESTHVGGDRFAGNLVTFPHGLYFGHVDPAEAPGIVAAYAEAAPRIGALERYRGRSSHRLVVQAADAAVRAELRLERVDDLVPRSVSWGEPDRASVSFDGPGAGVVARLERVATSPMRLTCHSEQAEITVRWRVVGIEPAA
jgi:hypothetical protein